MSKERKKIKSNGNYNHNNSRIGCTCTNGDANKTVDTNHFGKAKTKNEET